MTPGSRFDLWLGGDRAALTTPPYFHDGSAPTLKVAVYRMASGRPGRDLTDQEVTSIVVFLRTLTGRYHGHIVTI